MSARAGGPAMTAMPLTIADSWRGIWDSGPSHRSRISRCFRSVRASAIMAAWCHAPYALAQHVEGTETGQTSGLASLVQHPTDAYPAMIAAPPSVAARSEEGTAVEAHLKSLDRSVGLKGWNIPFPSFAESLSQDAGGYRSALANAGFGFIGWEQPMAATNLLDRPHRTNGAQAYWGQKPSVGNIATTFLTFDLGSLGLRGGQIAVAGGFYTSTDREYLVNAANVYRLSYYQSVIADRLELSLGLMGNGTSFVGTFVGGQIQNPFGPNASIPTELGLSASAVVQPTAWVKLHPTRSLYNLFGAARSVSPGGILVDAEANPTNLHFNVPGGRALYLDEIGYQTPSSVDRGASWFRAGVIRNTSRYPVLGSDRTKHKTGYYALIDRQILQTEAKSAETAYKGVYVGASVMYAPPSTSIFSQYYELRAYAKGAFASRPHDTMTLVYTHQVTSHRYASQLNDQAAETGLYARYFTNSLTASYNVHVYRGMYVTLGLNYLDHPSFRYAARDGDALNLLASGFFVF